MIMLGLSQLLAATIVLLCIPASTGTDLRDAQCKESEGEALLRLKQGFNDTDNILSSWALGSDCCNWEGVGCNETTGHVISLHLGNLGLQGKLNSALLGLPYLTYLDLSRNDFRWSQVPGFLGSLSHLQHLDLSDAEFFGTIPDHLGNLSRLILLDLSYNDLSVNNIQWLHHLSSLKVLDLSGLNLSSTTDGWIHAINMMPSLAELSLGDCELGYLPPSLPQVNSDSLLALSLDSNKFNSSTILDWLFQSCPNIRRIDLSNNHLTGPLPLTWGQTHLGKHPSLRELYLSNNHLYGPLTRTLAQLPELVAINVAQNDLQDVITDADFQNFSNLKVLILSRNHLIFNLPKNWVPPFQLENLGLERCQLGPHIPNWIRTQNNLSFIDISSNNISATVPNWFWDFSPNIEYMKLASNNLRGHVPDFSSNLKLRNLDLSNNSFASPFPYLPPNIRVLNLAGNSFFGPLSHICEMDISNLEFLDLSSNNLSGNLPNCWSNAANLLVLLLANNNISGPIPDSFGSLSYLFALSLNKNKFFGTLPLSLNNCWRLIYLDVGNNQLSGTIPSWINRDMRSLRALILSSNAFEGNIPKTLCQLKYLFTLDLSLNSLSGPIPPCIRSEMARKEADGYLSFLVYYDTTYMHSGVQPRYPTVQTYLSSDETEDLIFLRSHVELDGGKILPLVQLYDLSSNFITGDIPEEITDYVGLKSLNLSRNQLVGSIPFNIGKMKSLEALDLSRNNLSSFIPTSLGNMNLLSSLDVSYNNLTGQIPSDNYLNAFDSKSFMGNPNLCGRPLNKCRTNQSFEDGHGQLEKGGNGDGLEIPSFYITMGIGLITGFWTI